MNRTATLKIAALLALVSACSSEKTRVDIFQAASPVIEKGESTTLVFSASFAQRLTIDNGVGEVAGRSQVDVTPSATTTYTITATSKDGKTDTAMATVTVVPARAVGFLVEAPATSKAGETVTITVTALNKGGTAHTSFVGPANLTTTDAQAILPKTVAIDTAGLGKATVRATFKTAGSHNVVAVDPTQQTVKGTGTIRVANAAATRLTLSGVPASVRAGETASVRVAALDAFGNAAVDYRGTVALTSNDAAAAMPAAAAFAAGDAGARTFGVSFVTAGAVTLTASDGALQDAANATVRNAPAASIAVAAPAESLAGDAQQVQLTVKDRYANTAVDYTGTVTLSTSDSAAGSLGSVAFAAADQGTKSVGVALLTAGAQTIAAQDAAASLGGAAVIKVKSKPATKYRLSALPSTATAGDPLPLTITALDANDNVVTDYAGSAHVTSSEATDSVPGDGGFIGGVRNVALAALKAGVSHTFTVSEVGGTITATTNAVAVNPAAANGLTLVGAGTATAGAAVTYTATVSDRYGNAMSGYRGTLHFTSTDAQAALPTDYAFTSGDAGVHTFSVTLKTAGVQTVEATDGTLSASLSVRVGPSAVAGLRLSGVPAAAKAGEALAVTVTAHDAQGNVNPAYTGSVAFSSDDAKASLPATYSFNAGDAGKHEFAFKLGTPGSHKITAKDDAAPYTVDSSAIAVSPGPAAHFAFVGLTPTVSAGAAATASIEARDQYDNVATGYAGSIHVVTTDANAPAVADLTAVAGVASLTATLKTVGEHSILVSDAANASIAGSGIVNVTASAAAKYVLSALPATAVAGQPLDLEVTAMDDFGNVDTAYSGQAHFTGVTGDVLPADTAFTAGRALVGLSFTKTGSRKVTVSEVSGTRTADTNFVTVTSDVPAGIAVAPDAASVMAGAAAGFTATIKDRWGNTVPTYAGTVSFTSTDAQFVSPSAYTYAGGDAGVHAFSATFKTAGTQRLDVRDAAASIGGGAAWLVLPAAAATCAIDQLPTAASAGQLVSLRVTLSDAYANVATTYAGTMALSSTDSAAQFPRASATYVPATDKGAHVFTVRFGTPGLQSLTATDAANVALSCSRQVQVFAPSVHYSVTLPTDANVGVPVNAVVTALDGANKVIPDYAGTVTFASTDSLAAVPAPFTFDGTQGGTTTVAVTFNTLSTQALIATEQANPGVTGSGSTQVHGLVYTNPPAGTGAVRLVVNTANSTPNAIQLDVVASQYVYNGFGIGLNLPADNTRVIADERGILVPGTVFGAGTGVAARAATLQTTGPMANTLFTVVSAKNAAAGTGADVGGIQSGALYYSIRLKLNPAAKTGVVFDGAIAMANFRAAVRDRQGNDTVGQAQFAIGKLEVK